MFSIHRLRCASGEPLAVMINYLPLDIAPDAGELETNGLYLSLRARGVHIRLPVSASARGRRRGPWRGCWTRSLVRHC
jgi:hypothetical protein